MPVAGGFCRFISREGWRARGMHIYLSRLKGGRFGQKGTVNDHALSAGPLRPFNVHAPAIVSPESTCVYAHLARCRLRLSAFLGHRLFGRKRVPRLLRFT